MIRKDEMRYILGCRNQYALREGASFPNIDYSLNQLHPAAWFVVRAERNDTTRVPYPIEPHLSYPIRMCYCSICHTLLPQALGHVDKRLCNAFATLEKSVITSTLKVAYQKLNPSLLLICSGQQKFASSHLADIPI